MFTGIIQYIGKVVKVISKNSLVRLSIQIDSLNKSEAILKATPPQVNRSASGGIVRVGDSIAVNGVCLTVTSITGTRRDIFAFDVMPETISKTTFREIAINDLVNIETAILSGEPFGGHFVQGHIDAVGRISNILKQKGECRMQITCPATITDSIIEKGSIAIDGVSLTVVSVRPKIFSVALIPHTLDNTILGKKKVGDKVNLEVDMLGKYIRKLLPARPITESRPDGTDEGF
ncbi:MAG: riboflavin synthase [Planctomycetota bacterium]|nr:riboflavin synthase [Planctomycetota bacterium]